MIPRFRRPRHPRAFTLVEMVFVVGLMAVFALLASQTFILCYRATKDSNRRTEMLQRADANLALLRRDVWDSLSLSVNNNELRLGDGHSAVLWYFVPKVGLVRKPIIGAKEGNRTWADAPPIRFEVRGPQVLVHLTDQSHEQTMVLTSQVLQSQEVAP